MSLLNTFNQGGNTSGLMQPSNSGTNNLFNRYKMPPTQGTGTGQSNPLLGNFNAGSAGLGFNGNSSNNPLNRSPQLGLNAIQPTPKATVNTVPANQTTPSDTGALQDLLKNKITTLQSDVKKAQQAGYSPNQPIQGLIQNGDQVSGTVQPPPGGSVNANTGQNNPYTANPNLFQQENTAAANAAQNSQPVQQAYQAIQDLKTKYGQMGADISGGAFGLSEQQGSQGILNRQYSNALDAATQAYNAAVAEQGVQIGGYLGAAQQTMPQQYSPTGVSYNPVTGTYGGLAIGGGGNAVQGGEVLGQFQGGINIGQQSTQNSALIGKATNMASNLDNLINQNKINPSDPTFLNAWQNWARTNIFSDPAIPEFQGQLNDIVSSVAGVLGVPSSASSDFRTQFANQIVNSLQNGQSIQQAVNYFLQNATQANQGYLQGGANPPSPNGGGVNPGGNTAGNFFNK